MKVANSKAATILILGDIVAYLFSLILTLTVRYGELPSRALLTSHAPSFLVLFILFILISFSAGLYDKQSAFMRRNIQFLLIKVQLINAAIGIAFFYFAPVGIAPKANLFIYFMASTAFLLFWRAVMFPVISATRPQPAILVGKGDDIEDLYEEINRNGRYGISFKEKMAPDQSADKIAAEMTEAIKRTKSSIVIADLRDEAIGAAMPFLYSLIFGGVQIVDASKFYESVFDRVPLSLVGERWLVENASSALGGRRIYDLLKRFMDVLVGSMTAVLSLIFYPFVYVAVKMEDGGPLFIKQERIGKGGKLIRILKFRSMSANDNGAYANGDKTELKVTRVGKFIRLTRIDELPQLWSVIMGEQSLIGPRPELPSLVSVYEEKVPYYNVRHLIKPGLSGWAQIYHRAHPHHSVAVDDTRDKLSYDLYYIKNRSLGLDIRIALQTVKALLSRQGV